MEKHYTFKPRKLARSVARHEFERLRITGYNKRKYTVAPVRRARSNFALNWQSFASRYLPLQERLAYDR